MQQVHVSVIKRHLPHRAPKFFAGLVGDPPEPTYATKASNATQYAPTQASAVAKRLTQRTGNRHDAVKAPGVVPEGKGHKYRAKKTELDGIVFDSKKEARRYSELKTLEKAKEIFCLILQPEFKFPVGGENIRFCHYQNGRKGKEMVYRADFSYVTASGDYVVEDTKGMITPDAKIKLALMNAINGIRVKIL